MTRHGHVLHLFERIHLGLRNLHLELVSHAAVRVGPVVRHGEPARRRGRDQRARHVAPSSRPAGRRARGPRSRPRSDNRAPGRTARRAATEIFCKPVLHLFGELAIRRQVRAADRDFDRRRRAEAHHAADDVARLKGEPHVRQFAGEFLPQALLQFLNANARPGLSCTAARLLPGRRSRGRSG